MNDRMMDYFAESTFVVVDDVSNEIAGDINADGEVSFADFLVLNANFRATNATLQQGDIDKDGVVGLADYLLLSKNFGRTI